LQYRISPLYPGEGDRIIGLLQEIEHYQYNVDELEDMKNSADALIRISDKILGNDHSILNQQVIEKHTSIKNAYLYIRFIIYIRWIKKKNKNKNYNFLLYFYSFNIYYIFRSIIKPHFQ
jgi:uncharacterized protein (DUF2225 family)